MSVSDIFTKSRLIVATIIAAIIAVAISATAGAGCYTPAPTTEPAPVTTQPGDYPEPSTTTTTTTVPETTTTTTTTTPPSTSSTTTTTTEVAPPPLKEVSIPEFNPHDECGTSKDTFTVSFVEGAETLVNGVVTPPGTYTGQFGLVYEVTVRATGGYTLPDGFVGWSFYFTDEQCESSEPPAPTTTLPPREVCPNIKKGLTEIPAGFIELEDGTCVLAPAT